MKTKQPIERFLALVLIRAGGCWEWIGSKNSKTGYGEFVVDGRRRHRKKTSPYRFIWEWVNERSMPEGLEPDHTCNNRGCANPAHIEPVTHSENQRRSYERGRKRPGVDYLTRVPSVLITHCPQGHEYTSDNSRINSQGARICRACDRARCLAYAARKRAAA